MLDGLVVDIEDLPGGWTADQISTIRKFDAVYIISATDVELVAKYTTGMVVSSYIEILARAPFILVYLVNFHSGNRITIIVHSSSEEQYFSLVVTCKSSPTRTTVTWSFERLLSFQNNWDLIESTIIEIAVKLVTKLDRTITVLKAEFCVRDALRWQSWRVDSENVVIELI